MRSSGSGPALPVPLWPRLLLVAATATAVLAWVQAPSDGLYGYDGPYHFAYSRWLRDNGVSRQFPWWQETFLRDRFADKDFLYHVLLIPFTYGDLQQAGKTASIVFGAGLYAAIFLALAGLGARAPTAWTLGLLAGSTTLIYRAGLLRSHVLAIAIAVLGVAAILRGRRIAAAAAAALYCLAHIGWHLLPGFALLHAAVASVRSRRFRTMALPAVLAGAAAGMVLNPYLPNNLRLWWVQNVQVLSAAWGGVPDDLSLGLEVRPGRPRDFAYYNAGPLLFTAAGAAALLVRRAGAGASAGDGASPRGPSNAVLALGLATAGTLGLALASRRFVELWAPFSVLFAATSTTRALGERRLGRRARAAAMTAGALLATLAGAHHVGQARRVLAQDRGLIYTACASWIRDHVAEGEIVFTTDWDEFPELFYVAPRQRYLVGLDPTFMYVTNPERWRLWRRVAEGRAGDLYTPIRETFGSSVVFADAGHEAFVERADQDPLFRLEVGHFDCSVYRLREDAAGAPPLSARWRAVSGEWAAAGPRAFVDVERLAGAAADGGRTRADDRPCATLEGEIHAARSGTAVLGLSTDDSIRIDVEGRTIFDSEAAGPPSLDDLLERETESRGRMERRLETPLAAGSNRVTVATCRSGAAWGFHLRALPPP